MTRNRLNSFESILSLKVCGTIFRNCLYSETFWLWVREVVLSHFSVEIVLGKVLCICNLLKPSSSARYYLPIFSNRISKHFYFMLEIVFFFFPIVLILYVYIYKIWPKRKLLAQTSFPFYKK